MDTNDPSAKDPPGKPPRRSGRVQFDDRGQAIWEWELQTGMFDRNASTQRIKVLTQSAFDLRLEEPAPASPSDAKPSPTSGARPAAAAPRPSSGAKAAPPKPEPPRASGNPYDNAGPVRRPERSFDPYARDGGAKPPDTIDFDLSVYRPKR